MSLFEISGHEIALTDLLQIEDSESLLALRCPQTNIPIWPLLRIAFLRLIMAEFLFSSGSMLPPAQNDFGRAGAVLSRALLHNIWTLVSRRHRSDVMIQTDTIGDVLRHGLWYNRYADPFASVSPGGALLMADMQHWRWHTPRYNDSIVYHAPLQALTSLATKVVGRTSRNLADAITALACERASEKIGWDIDKERRDRFAGWAARKIAALPLRYKAYRWLLRRTKPRLLLCLGGCYGAHAPLIVAARELNIVTAEIQHGAISGGHDAYNFAPAIFDSPAYLSTLPEYLLTYGAWWTRQISAPVECVVIGAPLRVEKSARPIASGQGRRTVLILGDGIEFDLYLNLAREVAHGLSGTDLDVALRPHPLERRAVLDRYGEQVGDVRIDCTPNIFSSYASAHTVVSEVSTGLFEAVGLVDRIVMLNTAKARFAYPHAPFAAANSAEELLDCIIGNTPAAPQISEETLWASEWELNYERFLADKIAITR